jgi:hypothetical protein
VRIFPALVHSLLGGPLRMTVLAGQQMNACVDVCLSG